MCSIIFTYSPEVHNEIKFEDESRSESSGIDSEVQAAWHTAEMGCTSVIANGKVPNVILLVRDSYFRPSSCLAKSTVIPAVRGVG